MRWWLIERLQEVGRVGDRIRRRADRGRGHGCRRDRRRRLRPLLRSSCQLRLLRALTPRLRAIVRGLVPSMPCVARNCADVLERQLRRVLAAPVGQRRADRLGRFVAGNVVAAEAAVAAERAAGDVLELPLRAVVVVGVIADQHLLVDFHRRRRARSGMPSVGELFGAPCAGTMR